MLTRIRFLSPSLTLTKHGYSCFFNQLANKTTRVPRADCYGFPTDANLNPDKMHHSYSYSNKLLQRNYIISFTSHLKPRQSIGIFATQLGKCKYHV
jgi:hypothetical protein